MKYLLHVLILTNSFSIGAAVQPPIESIQWERLQQMFCKNESLSLTLYKERDAVFSLYAVHNGIERLPQVIYYNVPVLLEIQETFPTNGLFLTAQGKLLVKGLGQGREAKLILQENGVEKTVLLGGCEYLIAE